MVGGKLLSQLVPKDLIGETQPVHANRQPVPANRLNWSRRTSLVRLVLGIVTAVLLWRLNWSRRTSLVRPPFYGPGSIRRRKRFSNSQIRKIAKNCHDRTAPQPATVPKKKHRRGSPVTLLNTSGTRPTVCSPGSPSAALATFPADNCGGQVRLIAQPVPMQETAGCAQNTQTITAGRRIKNSAIFRTIRPLQSPVHSFPAPAAS